MVVRNIELFDHASLNTRQVNIIDTGEDWLDVVESNPLLFPGNTVYPGHQILSVNTNGDFPLVDPVTSEGNEFLPDIPVTPSTNVSFDSEGLVIDAVSDLGGAYEAQSYRAEVVSGPQFTINQGIDVAGSPPAPTNSVVLGGSVANNGVAIPDDPIFDSTTGVLSAEIWFRRDRASQSKATIMGKGRSATGEAGWALGFDWTNPGNSGALWVETEQGVNSMGSSNYWRFINPAEYLQLGGWYHLVLVIDPNEAVLADRVRLYRNAVAMTPTVTGTLEASRNANSQPLVIGKPAGSYTLSGGYGPYTYFRFYNDTALTQAQINDLHNGCVPIDASTIPSVSGVLTCQYILNGVSGLVDTEGNGPVAVPDAVNPFSSSFVTGCGP